MSAVHDKCYALLDELAAYLKTMEAASPIKTYSMFDVARYQIESLMSVVGGHEQYVDFEGFRRRQLARPR